MGPKTAALLLAFLLAPAPEGWHRTMEDGVKAARSSGKPVLVATAWNNDQ